MPNDCSNPPPMRFAARVNEMQLVDVVEVQSRSLDLTHLLLAFPHAMHNKSILPSTQKLRLHTISLWLLCQDSVRETC